MVARATLIGGAVALCLTPAIASGACVGTGRVTKVVNNASAKMLTLWVTPNATSGAITSFTTNNPTWMKTALAAQSKDMTIEVTGGSASCSVGGTGGAVVSILKKSQPHP